LTEFVKTVSILPKLAAPKLGRPRQLPCLPLR